MTDAVHHGSNADARERATGGRLHKVDRSVAEAPPGTCAGLAKGKKVFPGCAVPTVILNLGSRMVTCRSHQALPHGGAHRLAEAKATSLREHWFKEYMAGSNTPGNVDFHPKQAELILTQAAAHSDIRFALIG